MDKKIAVLIPCYNEELTIETVVKDYKQALPMAEVYVYDNNSKDRTVEKAREAGAIIRYEKTQGKGAVIRKMFYDIDADIYVMVDGDDTYPTDNITQLINLLIEGNYDLVIGDRLESGYFKENKKITHSIGNKIVPFMINCFYKTGVHDVMSGSRVFSKKFVKNFPAKYDGFETETEMIIYASQNHLRVGSYPIPYRDRPKGSKSKVNSIRDGMKIIALILKSSLNKKHILVGERK